MLAIQSIADAYRQPLARADNRDMDPSKALSREIEERLRAVRTRRLLEFIKTQFLDRGEKQSDAAKKLGLEPGHLSQYTMKKNPRGIGEGLARAMEQRADLPPFWLDDLVIDLTERERRLVQHFRHAPTEIQSATEAILARNSDAEAHTETVILPDQKAV